MVTNYQTQFETLSNRIVGLSSNAILSCFILGLKSHIKRELQALQPIINISSKIGFNSWAENS